MTSRTFAVLASLLAACGAALRMAGLGRPPWLARVDQLRCRAQLGSVNDAHVRFVEPGALRLASLSLRWAGHG